jgi:uncharacterized protein YbaP (TraB family)
MKTLFLALISIFIGNQSFTQKQESNSLLWKVYGKDVKDTSFLFGTIHIIYKNNFVLKDKVKRCFKKSEALVTEVSLDIPDSSKRSMATMAMYPQRKTVKDYLSAEDYAYFHSYLIDSLNINSLKVKIYEMMRPFFLESIVVVEQLGKIESYEQRFVKMAKKKEKLALETIEEQMAVVNGNGNIELQLKQLVADAKSGKLNANKEFRTMVNMYCNEDLNALYTYITNEMEDPSNQETGVSKAALLDNRNQKWIPQLSKWMSNKQLFIAVGAGHLAGEMGVINLLKQAGYQVEPVYY